MTIPGIFTQRDPRWSLIELGWNTDPYYNLYHFGCGVTAAANILWYVTGDATWTPQRVNEWLHNHDGYTDGIYINQGGLIIWGKLAELMRQYDIEYHGFISDLGATNVWLGPENNYALAQLSGPGFPMHFSAMPYVGMIADSWDGKLKSTSAYKFIGAHRYSRIIHAPVYVSQPAPEPAPIQAVVPAPVILPAPVPVASNTEPQPDPNPPLPTATHSEPTGQADGVVPVRTPAVANPVLEDLPPLMEYEETFKPDLKEVILKVDTAAIDMTGDKSPIHLVASIPYGTAGPFKSSGTFIEAGKKYYRGTSGGWYGVPADDVAEEASSDEVETAEPETPRSSGFWATVLNTIGRVIRLLSRRNS